MKQVQDLKQAIEYPQGGITSRKLFGDGVDVTLFCLAAGTSISEHTSTKKGLVQVIEGDGVFNLEGEEIAMKPGIMIVMPENAVHSLRAEKDTAFLLILF